MTPCTRHRRKGCTEYACKAEARRRTERSSTSGADDLADPTSPLHQAAHGSTYYGSIDTPGLEAARCDPPSSSSYDSGSSSCGGGE